MSRESPAKQQRQLCARQYHGANVVFLAKPIQNSDDAIASLVEKYSRDELAEIFLMNSTSIL